MKNLTIYTLFFLVTVSVHAQTLIATSLCPKATANHNQRKIVRDSLQNTFVVFVDSLNQETVIKGVWYNVSTLQWSAAVNIVIGNNPTLSISQQGRIHLVYESNDSIAKIRHLSSPDFISWSPSVIISDSIVNCKLPVSDIDSAGKLNIFWKQNNGVSSVSLIYACLNGDTLIDRKCITTKNEINDIAIANHLQYIENDLFFAIQTNDSVLFFRSVNNLNSYQFLYGSLGASQPCITYNSFLNGVSFPEDNNVRLVYRNEYSALMEVEWYSDYTFFCSRELQGEIIDYVCVDNIAPPIGYSYLFIANGTLFHGFSYGACFFYWSTIMNTISSSPINPSIAYKTFNFLYVDYIWMQNSGAGFNIFHRRDQKHIWSGLEDPEQGKGFSIIGYPNPFSEQFTIKVTVDEKENLPEIKIYNTKSQLVNVLKAASVSGNDYSYKWNGTNMQGDELRPGIYVIMCSVGDKKTARKVVFMKR